MGMEIPQEYNGTGAGFMSAILVIEELAKVSVRVCVSVDLATRGCVVDTLWRTPWGCVFPSIIPRLMALLVSCVTSKTRS